MRSLLVYEERSENVIANDSDDIENMARARARNKKAMENEYLTHSHPLSAECGNTKIRFAATYYARHIHVVYIQGSIRSQRHG